jgi:hypothetical protein
MITGGHIFVLCLILLLIYLLFNKSKREKYEYKNYPIDVSWTNGDGTLAMVTKWIVVVVTPDGTEYTAETTSLEDRTDGSTVNLTVNDVVLKPGNNKITIKLLFDDLYGRKNIQFYKYEVEKIIYDDYENVVKINNFEGCYEGEWTNSGSCSSEGKQLQTRETFGNCDDLSTEREIDCCYQTPWVGDNTCESDGKIRQTREAAGNCDDLSTERTFDCCYQTEWVNSGSCSSEGKQLQIREAAGNCDDLSTERTLDCCYQTEWVNSGSCSSEGKQLQIREVAGDCDDLSTERTLDCCYQSEWVNSGSCSSEGKQLQIREVAGDCDDMATEREIDCNFYGPWTMTDKCSSNGKITEERTVTRGGNVTKEEQDSSTECCYQTGWVGNTCGSDGKIRQTREAAGNCDDLSTERTLDCCYKTNWNGRRCIDGVVTQTREVVGATCTGEGDEYTIRKRSCNNNLTTNANCGKRKGECISGCCSKFGWCGTGISYCYNNSEYNAASEDWSYE